MGLFLHIITWPVVKKHKPAVTIWLSSLQYAASLKKVLALKMMRLLKVVKSHTITEPSELALMHSAPLLRTASRLMASWDMRAPLTGAARLKQRVREWMGVFHVSDLVLLHGSQQGMASACGAHPPHPHIPLGVPADDCPAIRQHRHGAHSEVVRVVHGMHERSALRAEHSDLAIAAAHQDVLPVLQTVDFVADTRWHKSGR